MIGREEPCNRRNRAWKLIGPAMSSAALLGKWCAVSDPFWSRATPPCADKARRIAQGRTGRPGPSISTAATVLSASCGRRPACRSFRLTHLRQRPSSIQRGGRIDLPAAARRLAALIEANRTPVRSPHGGVPGGDEIIERYRAIDDMVYHALLPYRDRIWDIAGLGEETTACAAR